MLPIAVRYLCQPNFARIVALFDEIYDGEPILTVLSNIGEDVQYRCFNVKSESQPITILLFLETIIDFK
jgi:hypothetical protein